MSDDWHDVKVHLDNWQRYSIWDRTLYDLCQRHFHHEDKAAVVAKVFLIGRSYQTGLERHIRAVGSAQKGLDQVADLFKEHSHAIDQHLRALKNFGDVPPSTEILPAICLAHFDLMSLAKTLTKAGSPRSFASKYLHFHAPVVPIYDSIASRVIGSRAWKPWTGGCAPEPKTTRIDQTYWTFCHRIVRMAESWRADGVSFSPTSRNLDSYLLGWGIANNA